MPAIPDASPETLPLYSLLLGGVSNSITFTLDLATSILSHLVAMAT